MVIFIHMSNLEGAPITNLVAEIKAEATEIHDQKVELANQVKSSLQRATGRIREVTGTFPLQRVLMTPVDTDDLYDFNMCYIDGNEADVEAIEGIHFKGRVVVDWDTKDELLRDAVVTDDGTLFFCLDQNMAHGGKLPLWESRREATIDEYIEKGDTLLQDIAVTLIESQK